MTIPMTNGRKGAFWKWPSNTPGKKRAKAGDAQVICDDCKRRVAVTLADVLRTNKWPECHEQVMRLMTEKELARYRSKTKQAEALVTDAPQDPEEEDDGEA